MMFRFPLVLFFFRLVLSADFYASPNGAGADCSRLKPCRLPTAATRLSAAASANESAALLLTLWLDGSSSASRFESNKTDYVHINAPNAHVVISSTHATVYFGTPWVTIEVSDFRRFSLRDVIIDETFNEQSSHFLSPSLLDIQNFDGTSRMDVDVSNVTFRCARDMLNFMASAPFAVTIANVVVEARPRVELSSATLFFVNDEAKNASSSSLTLHTVHALLSSSMQLLMVTVPRLALVDVEVASVAGNCSAGSPLLQLTTAAGYSDLRVQNLTATNVCATDLLWLSLQSNARVAVRHVRLYDSPAALASMDFGIGAHELSNVSVLFEDLDVRGVRVTQAALLSFIPLDARSLYSLGLNVTLRRVRVTHCSADKSLLAFEARQPIEHSMSNALSVVIDACEFYGNDGEVLSVVADAWRSIVSIVGNTVFGATASNAPAIAAYCFLQPAAQIEMRSLVHVDVDGAAFADAGTVLLFGAGCSARFINARLTTTTPQLASLVYVLAAALLEYAGNVTLDIASSPAQPVVYSMAAPVNFGLSTLLNHSDIRCPVGSRASVSVLAGDETTPTFTWIEDGTRSLAVECAPCGDGTYSLSAGALRDGVASAFACQPCPADAFCANGLLRARTGFWLHPNTSSLSPCAPHACVDGACDSGRRGRLCSACDATHRLELVAMMQTRCVAAATSDGDETLFEWLWLGVYIFAFAGLAAAIVGYRMRVGSVYQSGFCRVIVVFVNLYTAIYLTAPPVAGGDASALERALLASAGGALSAAAPFVELRPPSPLDALNGHLIAFIWPLTFIVAYFIVVFVYYLLCRGGGGGWRRRRRATVSDDSLASSPLLLVALNDDNQLLDSASALPFAYRAACAGVQTIEFVWSSLVAACLTLLLPCVPIDGAWWLLIDAEHTRCYTSWQVLVMLVLVLVLLLLGALEVARRRAVQRAVASSVSRGIRDALQSSFRLQRGAWTTVLYAQRLALVIMARAPLPPLLRSLAASTLAAAFLAAELVFSPWRVTSVARYAAGSYAALLFAALLASHGAAVVVDDVASRALHFALVAVFGAWLVVTGFIWLMWIRRIKE